MDSKDSDLQATTESEPKQGQRSPTNGQGGGGGGWPLKNITKRFSSRKNHQQTQIWEGSEDSTRSSKQQVSVPAVSKKNGNRQNSKTASRKQQSEADLATRTRTRCQDSQQQQSNNGRNNTVIRSRLTSASTKLTFCFTAHCITAVESPNSTIQSVRQQDHPPLQQEDIASWHEIAAENEERASYYAARDSHSSRSPYECPICFEQYQFDFDNVSEVVHMDAEGSENTLEATGEDSNAQSEQQETGSGDNSNAKFQEALTSFRDHLPRLMQCGHTLCSKCLGKLGEDMSAKVLGFVKCPICREMHYTEPVEDAGSNCGFVDYTLDGAPETSEGGATGWSNSNSQSELGASNDVASSVHHKSGGHQFVFRVNYALLSAIEHNLMHISAEDLAHMEDMEVEEGPPMCKTLERKARHRKTYSMYETMSNRVNTCSTRTVNKTDIGGCGGDRGGPSHRREATHVTFEDIQKMLRPELIISQQHLSAIHMSPSPLDSRAESERTITASEN